MLVELGLLAVGTAFTGRSLLEQGVIKRGQGLIEKGQLKEARSLLESALRAPIPWSTPERRGSCLLLYLLVSDSPTEATEKVEKFLASEEFISDRLGGLLNYELSKLLSLSGEPEQASSARDRAWQLLSRVDDDPSVLWPLGQLAKARGWLENAQSFYRQAIAAGADRDNCRLGLALTTSQEEEREELLESLIQDDEVDPQIKSLAQRVMAAGLDDSSRCLSLLEQSLEAEPADESNWVTRVLWVGSLFENGRTEEGERELDALTQEPYQDPNLWVVTLSQAARWAQAWEVFHTHPPTTEAVATLALNVAYQSRNDQEALEIADRWIGRPVGDRQARIRLLSQAVGTCHSLNDLERAEEYLRRSRKQFEDEQEFTLLQAEHQRLCGRLDDCLVFCQRARSQGSVAPEIRYWWTLGEFDKVRENIKEQGAEPDNDELKDQLLAGAALVCEERFEEGFAILEPLLDKIENPESQHYYGAVAAVALAGVGETTKARNKLEELDAYCGKLTTGAGYVYRSWKAEAFYHLGQLEEALSLSAELLGLAPPVDQPALHYGMGLCHKEQENMAEATSCFRRAQSCPQTHYAKKSLLELERLQ